MRTLLRVIAIVLGVVALLAAAAALVLPRLIDPNVYRQRIAALVEERTGRQLTIGGDIGWSVFPWLGVELGEVRLANAPGFGAEPFMQVSAMQVRVKLLPLLRKEVEMSTVLLEGLQVRLAKAKDGRTNWADLFAAKGEARTPVPSDRKSSAAASPAAIAVGGVRVRDAMLIWDDEATGAHYTLDKINLRTDAIRGDQPIGVDFNFNAKGSQPAFESTVRMRGQVVPMQAFTRVEVRDLRLEIAAHGKQLPRGGLNATLSGRMAYAADRNSLELDDLMLNVLDLNLRGQARGSDVGGAAPRLDGSLRIDTFAPRELMAKLRIQAPESSDPDVLQRAEADADFILTATAAQLRTLKLRFDDSLLTGGLRVENFAKPSTQFQLALDRLDLDRYLPPPAGAGTTVASENDAEGDASDGAADVARPSTQGAAAESRARAGRKAPPPLLPVAALRDLRLNGSLRIGELKVYQIRSNDVDVTLSAANGSVRIAPARAKLYQGRYDGNIAIDVSGKQPRFTLNEKLSGVQFGPLLKDIQGDAKLTGKADIALKLNAFGNRAPAIRRSMNGDARFALTDGTVKGMDVLGEIRRAYAVLRGRAPAQMTDETEFSALTGSATIVKGVVTNRDLQGKSPLMQIQGSGSANLVTDALDYRVTATLVDALEGEGELTGRPIPVRITGTLSKPKVGVDMQQVIKQEARKQVEKKIQEKLQDNLKGGLKGLLGR